MCELRLKAQCHVKGAERAWLARASMLGAAAVLPSSGTACQQALLETC